MNTFIPNVCIDVFKRQVEYLKRKGYTSINTSQLYDYLYQGVRLPKKSIIITFDDGYKENIDAYKILYENGFTSICFVATSFLCNSYNYMPFYLGERTMSYKLSDVKDEEFVFMDMEDIKRAIKYGVEICGHTHHHIDIPDFSEKQIREEVIESKKVVDSISGANSVAFSYPRGKYNELVEQMLPSIGIYISFAVKAGVITKDSNPLELPRYNVPSEMALFKLALTNKIVLYERLSRLINR